MREGTRYGLGCAVAALTAFGCASDRPTLGGDGGSSSGGADDGSSLSGYPLTTAPPLTSGPADGSGTSDELTTGLTMDPGSTGAPGTGEPGCAPDCPSHAVDVLFVIDNTRGMPVHQRKLAQAVPGLMSQLASLEASHGIEVDLHVMVTTTDFGNPLCDPFAPAGYDAAMGAPIATPCVERLDQFDGLVGDAVPEACTDVCAIPVGPTAPFVHVAGGRDNVDGGSATEALQCLLPQGNIGCGFESPLETMLHALDPGAAWNAGADPFLRPGADLAIVLLTNEMDCSVADYGIMTDTSLMNINPATGMPTVSSALCFNAGVDCDGPDAMGVYSNCVPDETSGLQPTSRYIGYLLDELATAQGKRVSMIPINGIPPVQLHDPAPPYVPTAGGVDDLVYRQWAEFEWPNGDILPEDWAMGVTAADMEFTYGIGPGCTGQDDSGELWQALPPTRITAVCEALDGQGPGHCCMESVCGSGFASAMTCLRGMVEAAL